MSIASVIKAEAKNRALRTGLQVVVASGLLAGIKAAYDGFIGGTINIQSVETAAAIGALAPVLAFIQHWKFSPASVPQIPAVLSEPIVAEAQTEAESAITTAESDLAAQSGGPEINTQPALDIAAQVAAEVAKIQQAQQPVTMPPPTDGTGTPTPAS